MATRRETGFGLTAVDAHGSRSWVAATGARGQVFRTPHLRHALSFAAPGDATRWVAEQPEHTRADLAAGRFVVAEIVYSFAEP